MPLKNLENKHFSSEEKTTIFEALHVLQNVLEEKSSNLTAEERKRYGSVNEQNKLIINKVKEMYETEPEKCSPDVEWTEFFSDYDSRIFLEKIILGLEELLIGCRNTKILHDYDNYQDAMKDYEFAKYKSNAGVKGYETKIKELKQFFNRTNTKNEVEVPEKDTPKEV